MTLVTALSVLGAVVLQAPRMAVAQSDDPNRLIIDVPDSAADDHNGATNSDGIPSPALLDLRTIQLPGSGPSAAVPFPGDPAATPIQHQGFDLDPAPDSSLPVYTFFNEGEPSLMLYVFDQCERGGGLNVFGASDHQDLIEVEFARRRGSPVQGFEIPGVESGAGGAAASTSFIADLDCTESRRGGKRSVVNGQGTWSGGQNYSEAVKVSQSKRGNGYDTVTNTRGQVARDLGADRAGLVWNGSGEVEVTIPVSVRTQPAKNKVVVESIVVYAPAKGSPSTKQTRRTVNQLGNEALLRVHDAVAAGKTPKGGDRLGFQKNANWSSLTITFKDNAKTHALVDDWFGHTVTEVPPPGSSLGPVRLQVQTGDGGPVDIALASQFRLARESDSPLDTDESDAVSTTLGMTVSLYHQSMTRGGLSLLVISDLAPPGTSHTSAAYSPFEEVITRRLPSLDAALAKVDDAKTQLDAASAEFEGGYADLDAARRLPLDTPAAMRRSKRSKLDRRRLRLHLPYSKTQGPSSSR